ncbi:RNA polymerase II-associated protein [Desulfurivibrio dismutans]|uniref:RNA polymerase II-associated protein n=1 Tax=Desulfurivibrio dismutans TaxID=1398908 RepID=UPI0023D9B383|nr:RNA polymerase II-associated protein [Desulfurivibrio alkaliphilus]MDF1613557.1 hypothetical protein [Desulfurivibrio alkaliphilus]
MELFCEKYREKMAEEEAYCKRPGEYCKFRSACIIHFAGQERGRQRRRPEGGANREESATSDSENRAPRKNNA